MTNAKNPVVGTVSVSLFFNEFHPLDEKIKTQKRKRSMRKLHKKIITKSKVILEIEVKPKIYLEWSKN